MKRICLLYNHDLSTQTRTLRQVETLLNAGFHVSVYCLAESKDRRGVETKDRLAIHRIFKKRLYKYHAFSLRLLKRFSRVLTTQPRHDIVHVIDAPMLPLGWLLSKAWNAKLVYDASELWDALYDEEKERLLNNPQHKPKERQTKLAQLERTRAFEHWALPRCDGVISVSESIASLLRTHGSLKHYATIRNIAKYHDISRSTRIHEHFQLPTETKVIVYQGMLAEKRGLGKALDALELLKLENFAFVMMGPIFPADKTYVEALLQRVETSPSLKGKVFYRGFMPPNELLHWTASADLGLQPIINWNMNHYLCLPNKVFEYIQAGLPIGASNFPELQQLIHEYELGFTFNPEDPQDMAQKIDAYFSNPEQQQRFREKVAIAKEILTWENEEPRLTKLYQDILSN